jgi:hypothetical protein
MDASSGQVTQGYPFRGTKSVPCEGVKAPLRTRACVAACLQLAEADAASAAGEATETW